MEGHRERKREKEREREREREMEIETGEDKKKAQLRGCLHFSGSCIYAGSSLTIEEERKETLKCSIWQRQKARKVRLTRERERERNDRPIDHRLFWCIVQHCRGRLWPIRRTHGHQFPLIKSFGLFTITPHYSTRSSSSPCDDHATFSGTCGSTNSTHRIFYNPQENRIKRPLFSPLYSCSFHFIPSFCQQ